MARVNFLRIYFVFAAAYLLSYLFRSVNAVISPELSRDLSLNPASLGLLTSAYFLAFGAAQIPVGMLLDRYGPRRVAWFVRGWRRHAPVVSAAQAA